MKTNYKRALKAMAKMEKRIYFDTLDNVVLVSESHFIISVPYADWQELVEGVNSVFEKNTMTQIDLKKIFVDNKDGIGVRCKMTNAAIYCGDKLARVFKANNALGVFNEKFLDVVRDTIHADYLANSMTVKTTNEQIKKVPMVHADFDANDKLISGVAIFPINCNVRDVFNHILE